MAAGSVSTFQKIKRFLERHEVLILLLCFHLLLRIPNLFEPYWYGDEGIYLTIGNSMNQGLKLYAETVDHKTPLIYYFAFSGSQFWFRMILLGWMTMAIVGIYTFIKRIGFRVTERIIATALFIFLTTLPWLEGNIPNGELFVIGFIAIALYAFSETSLLKFFQINHRATDDKTLSLSQKDLVWLFVCGLALSGGILTKVPALFDALAVLSLGFWVLVHPARFSQIRKNFSKVFLAWLVIGLGILTPIILSIGYFAVRGTLGAYIDFGLLYNFRYTASWQLPELPFNLQLLLTQPAKFAITVVFLLMVLILRKHITPITQFLLTWTILALFASLLSSRPYPHYFIQLVPPLVLLAVQVVRKNFQPAAGGLFATVIVLIIGAFLALDFSPYPTIPYYTNFFKFVTHAKTKEQYFDYFNPIVNENYQVTQLLTRSPDRHLFIWGNNPMLYAMSKKIPVGKYTVTFHILDIPGAKEEVGLQLRAIQPEYIVVMKNERAEFETLSEMLWSDYVFSHETNSMVLYRKFSLL